jgi:hypothetical protein
VAPLWAAPNLWQFLPAPPKSLSGGQSLEGTGGDALTAAALRLAPLLSTESLANLYKGHAFFFVCARTGTLSCDNRI